MVPGPRARESRSPLDSRTPRGNPRGVLSFYAARLYCWTGLRLRLALAATAGQYRPPAAHGPCRRTASGTFSFLRPRFSRISPPSGNRLSMLFVFLCLHTGRAGNRAVMRTCNICTLNIPTWHIDKKSIKISKMYTPRPRSNCSLEL